MRELCALAVSDQAKVLDHIVDRCRAPLYRLRCVGDMLYSFLARLQEIHQVGGAQGIEVSILVRDGSEASSGMAAAHIAPQSLARGGM